MDLKWKLLGLWWRIRSFNPPVMARRIKLAPDAARADVVRTYETEYPYRPGYGLVLHLYGSHGVLLGVLQPKVDLDDAAIDARLLLALRAAEGPASWRKRAWLAGRAAIDAGDLIEYHARSAEEAREFSDMLGLDDWRTKVARDDA